MLSRFFQESDHLLALYAWEPLEELLDGIARFQMIEKTLHGDASSSENRLPAKNFRMLRYDATHAEQNTAWPCSPQNRCSLGLNLAIERFPFIYRKSLTTHERGAVAAAVSAAKL